MITLLILLSLFGFTLGQEITPSCGGSVAGAVFGTFFATLLITAGALFLWKRFVDKKDNHLILETDPESGKKGEYAFDNPGFKDPSIIATATSEKNAKQDSANKNKWGNWNSALSALTLKHEKKKASDDSNLISQEVKVVSLKSQDFTGLGFNICGNMREGIYIKDILHRGPAFESGKLSAGDRINSVTISFEHMVYDDALNILSYASPYEVMIEAKSGRYISHQPGQGNTPVHPIYRSSSAFDLYNPEKTAKKKLFDDYSSSSNYSSLQKSRSNVTTLERNHSKSPRPLIKKPERSPQKLHPEVLERSLEEQLQTSEIVNMEKSPKIMEQNQNNLNIEIQHLDEPDHKPPPPQARKREKKSPEPVFERIGSGLKRDENGIPLEIPEHMQDVAMMAKRNRKSMVNGEESGRRVAPSPPPEMGFGLAAKSRGFEDLSTLGNQIHYSDSEDDTTKSSTIELNSTDITVHQEEQKSRKTASTGDLTKMKPRSNTGTLERAQSLDITDTTSTNLTTIRNFDATENLLMDKEPRLSLILDGLSTIQRDKLKTSTEWGDLEDAILNFRDDRRQSEPQFNAVMDKVIQIKRESLEVEIPDEVVRQYVRNEPVKKVVNKLWPDEEELVDKFETSGWKVIEEPVVPERTKPKPSERTKIDFVVQNTPNLSVEFECVKPVPPKREKTPDKETVINLNNNFNPVTTFEKSNITEICSQLAKGRNCDNMIKDEWESDVLNTSPPSSLMEEVMDSYNNYNVVVSNLPDETKSVENLKTVTAEFLLNEQYMVDTNIPDDVKVSRYSEKDLISHVTVENGGSNLHSLELSINNDLYTTALDNVVVSSPVTVTESKFTTFKTIDDESPAISLTEVNGKEDPEPKNYITEIQVTTPSNVSEVQIGPNEDHLENAFENYVKNFEKKLEQFETNFENDLAVLIDQPSKLQRQKSDVEILSKIQEIAEEQLKTLPEMRFSTSSYESGGRKTPEKRHSIELLRSNFEKTPSKSRIPIATPPLKTPPMSPERRDSRNLENENDQALLELMSSSISSTPFTSKIKPPTPTKNISVTSIKSHSKIPSGLGRPPMVPRRNEDGGANESSFKQWVFNPNSNVTNVTVGKDK